MIYIWGGVLVVLVLVGFFVPLIRRTKGSVSRVDSANAMLRDQLVEIDKDIFRGLISIEDGHAATIEVKRRIIALNVEKGGSPDAKETGHWAIAGAGILVPVFAVALYLNIGSQTIPSVRFADGAEERAEASQRDNLVQELRSRLEADENGGPTEGWLLLADAYMRMGQYEGAADAYSRVLERNEATVSDFTQFAEALILLENGQVTPLAERALDQALLLSPNNTAAIYYKSFALEQSGETVVAFSMLVARLDAADGFYPWMESYVAQANFYGEKLGRPAISLTDYAPILRGPSAEDIAGAADMSEDDRNDFIASMVEQLAQRLQQEPNDLDGWLKLARAYTVLGDDTGATGAYQNAALLIGDLPDSDPRRAIVLNNLSSSD